MSLAWVRPTMCWWSAWRANSRARVRADLSAALRALGALVVVEVVSFMSADVFQQVGHFDGHACRVTPFFFLAGDRLLQVLGGEDGVGERDLVVQGQARHGR